MADKKKPEEKGMVEGAAEKTGELVGTGVKKGWGAVKAFGKGAKNAVSDKDKKKE